MSHAVFCIADTETKAISIVNRLKNAGFSHEISVLLPDKGGSRDFAHKFGRQHLNRAHQKTILLG